MLPNDWRLYKLEQLSTKAISYGVVQTGDLIEGGVACVRVVDLTSSELDPKMMITTNQEINQAYKKTILEKGELMIALRGEIGLVRLVDEKIIGCNLTRGIARVAPKINLVNSDYLLWAMRAPMCRRDFIRRANGSALQEISISELRKIIVPIPSLPEQKKIAEILETWDEAIALTKKAIAAKQKLKKNLSEKVFSGFLNISNKTDEWRSERLGNISETFSGGTPSRSYTSYFEGNIPWIKSGEINQEIIFSAEEFISDEGFHNSSAKIIEPETILIAMYGATAGKIAVSKIRAAINQAILAVVPKSEINRDFLYYFLKHRMDKIIRKVQGGQPNLNSKIIKETKILLPPFTEQVEIGKLLSLLDSETRSLERLQNLFEFQKQGLMQKLLTGKWRVTVESDV